MLVRQHIKAITEPLVMATSESADIDADVVHEVTVKLDEGPQPEAWAGLTPPTQVRSLDALHHMLHEASVLSSHLQGYKGAVEGYASHAAAFFDAARDFLASSGSPVLFENTLTPEGVSAARAATAAASAAGTGMYNAESSAAAGVAAAEAHPHSPQAQDQVASPTGSMGSTGSAFKAESQVPRLPLMAAAGLSGSGVALCPGVPSTAALGVSGGLTKVAPAELHLPGQHAALFSTEQQRTLVNRGQDAVREVFRAKLLPTIQLWLDTFQECKEMLPKVEQLRIASDKARAQLDASMAAVLQAEANHPLTTPSALTQAGLAVPRVLVRGSEGTVLMQQQAVGGMGGGEGGASSASSSSEIASLSGAADVGEAGAGPELVAVPAVEERREMYEKDQAETDASLAFELSEKVLRDRLKWLVTSGAGLKALLAAALGHALAAAAASGQPGEAPGGTTGGLVRAPVEELLSPFPTHVLARLQGDHLPSLPDVVLADQARLARWCDRYKAAMAAEAAATAAAAGAQMMAAATTSTEGHMNVHVPTSNPEMLRTDEGSRGGPASGTAAVLDGSGSTVPPGGSTGEAPAGPDDAQSVSSGGGGGGGVSAELARVAAKSGLPVDLLAAAVAADVQEQEAAAAKSSKGEIAWHLLHDASMAVGKEQAVLLPEVSKAVGGLVPSLLADSHTRISEALSGLSRCDPATPGFDVTVLEVVEALEGHNKVLSNEVLPALSESDSKSSLRSLAAAYRRAAASAPTRPHTWLLNTGTGAGAGNSSSNSGTDGQLRGRAGRWVSAAAAATGRLVKAPVRAGVALADAAADAAHYGPRHMPMKA